MRKLRFPIVWAVLFSFAFPARQHFSQSKTKKVPFIVIGLEFPQTATTGTLSDHRQFPAAIITTTTDQYGTRRQFNNTVKNRIFGTGWSVADYYKKNSYGKFELENAGLFGPYQADEAADHYWTKRNEACKHGWKDGHGERRALAIQKLIAEEINKRKTFDLSKYDTNKDNKVTYDELAVAIVCPQATTYGVARGAVPKEGTKDAFKVGNISWDLYHNNDGVVEMFTYDFGGNRDLGLLSHELAHAVINADDMYENSKTLPNTKPPGWDPTAPGPFGLMDNDSYHAHLDPLHKMNKGKWVAPIVVKKDGYYNLRAIENHADYYKLADPSSHKGEYFIVENRQHINYDNLIPCSGLLIWHIDETRSDYRSAAELEPAIGPKFPIPWQHYCYPCTQTGSVKDFWHSSKPVDSKWHDKTDSYIGVWSVPSSSSTMRVYLDVPGPGILAEITPESRQLGANSSTTYTVRLVNTGPKTDTFDLYSSGLESSWTSWSTSQVTLKSYEQKNVAFTVKLGQCPDEGTYPFSVGAFSITNSSIRSTDGAKLVVLMQLQTPLADAYETNNSTGTATAVQLGLTGSQSSKTLGKLTLHNATDVDYFKITYQSKADAECKGGSKSWSWGSFISAFGPQYYPGGLTIQVDEEFCRPMDLEIFNASGTSYKKYPNVRSLAFDCPTNIFPSKTLYVSVKRTDKKSVRYKLNVSFSNWYVTLKKPLYDPGKLRILPPPISQVINPKMMHFDFYAFIRQVEEWMPMYQDLRHRMDEADMYHGMGTLSLNLGIHEEAERFLHQALESYAEMQDQNSEADIHRELGVLYSQQERTDEAMEHFERAMGLHAMAGNEAGQMEDRMSLGHHFSAAGDYGNALHQFQQAFQVQERMNDIGAMASNLFDQATVFQMSNQQEGYMACLFLARPLAASMEDPDLQTEIEHHLERIFELMGDEEFVQLQERMAEQAETIRQHAMQEMMQR